MAVTAEQIGGPADRVVDSVVDSVVGLVVDSVVDGLVGDTSDGDDAPRSPVEIALDDLLAALDQLALALHRDPVADTPAVVDRLVLGLSESTSLLDAALTTVIDRWDEHGCWSEDGSTSAVTCLVARTRTSPAAARAVVRRALALRGMPGARRAYDQGLLTTAMVDLLIAVRDRVSPAERYLEDEDMLIDFCRRLGHRDAKRALDYWAARVDAAGNEKFGDERRARRSLSASPTFDDLVRIDGYLEPCGGTVFLTELRRLEHQMKVADAAAGSDRTPTQRRADALVEMATRSSMLGTEGQRPRPLITLITGAGALSQTCELSNGVQIAPGQVVPFLSEADIEHLVIDDASRVLSVSRRRTFTGALRRAIEVRDRHCQHPSGCDVPADRCDVDHIVPYAAGGETSQANGRLLCATHNRDPRLRDRRPKSHSQSDWHSEPMTERIRRRLCRLARGLADDRPRRA